MNFFESPLWKEIDNNVSCHPVAYSRERVNALSPALRMLLRKGGGSIVVFETNTLVLEYLKTEEAFTDLSGFIRQNLPLNQFPAPLYIHKKENIEEQYGIIKEEAAKHGITALIALQGLGVFAWGETRALALFRITLFFNLVKLRHYTLHNPAINPETCAAAFRDAFPEPVGVPGTAPEMHHDSITGKIALVTGAARGIGLGIAEFLAGRGAHLVLADVNGGQAALNAQALNEKYGSEKAVAVAADVTDETQVRQMVNAAVGAFGGLDILVSNAGMLKAGSLEDITLADFELSTKVNYTAFFLCTRYAVAPMKIQSRFAGDYFMDIIQINSKSGLSGSKKNFAYAGSKFGGIGLTGSFALELAEYNIKVNAVCPGNFFEGPLWSDPEKGLFVQYLKSGKVPGAATVEDVRKYYENQVPMKRGCGIGDIVKAIAYIIDQEYETGQAIPVTGGQIMLK